MIPDEKMNVCSWSDRGEKGQTGWVTRVGRAKVIVQIHQQVAILGFN